MTTFRGTELPNADAEKAYGIIRENLVRYQTPLSYRLGTAGLGTTAPTQIITREVVKVGGGWLTVGVFRVGDREDLV